MLILIDRTDETWKCILISIVFDTFLHIFIWTVLSRENRLIFPLSFGLYKERRLDAADGVTIGTSLSFQSAVGIFDEVLVSITHPLFHVGPHLAEATLVCILYGCWWFYLQHGFFGHCGERRGEFCDFVVVFAVVVDHVAIESLLYEFFEAMAHECLGLFLFDDGRFGFWDGWTVMWWKWRCISFGYFSALHWSWLNLFSNGYKHVRSDFLAEFSF
jgi:hypothetical protein